LDLIRLLRRQTQLCVVAAICANFMLDSTLLGPLPDLKPFAALSPALAIAARVVDALRHLALGQSWLAWDTFNEVHASLSSPQAAGMDGLTAIALRNSTLGYLCALEVEHACPNASAHLDDYSRWMPHNAQSMRARYWFAIGDPTNWLLARKQSELLSVESNSLLETRHTDTAAYLAMFSLADDVLGLRRVHGELKEIAATRPGWRYRVGLAQCHVLRCQSHADDALAIAELSFASVPAEHPDFVAAAVAHVESAIDAQANEAARVAALSYLERARSAAQPTARIELVLARAHAELDEHDSAETHFATAMHAFEQRQVRGLLLGRALEIGARVALRRGDARTFAERADQCAQHYAVKRSPSLTARFGKLLRDAARAGLVPTETPNVADRTAPSAALQKLAVSADDSQFYAAALDFLVKSSGASSAFLYVCANEGLRAVAGTDSISAAADSSLIDRVAREHYERERAGGDASTTLGPATIAHKNEILTLWPCALSRPDVHGRTIEGIVVFVSDSPAGTGIPRASLEHLATLITLHSESISRASSLR
jgi:hypothetical protein